MTLQPGSSFTVPPAISLPAAFASSGFSLRDATAADAAFERILFGAARPDAALLAAWPHEMQKAFLDQQFDFQTTHFARGYPHAAHSIVQAADEPIGRFILDCGTAEWCVVDIALMPPWRGRGLGGALLEATQAAAARARVPVTLTVDFNSPARRLYERLGFAVVVEAIPNIAMAWRPD